MCSGLLMCEELWNPSTKQCVYNFTMIWIDKGFEVNLYPKPLLTWNLNWFYQIIMKGSRNFCFNDDAVQLWFCLLSIRQHAMRPSFKIIRTRKVQLKRKVQLCHGQYLFNWIMIRPFPSQQTEQKRKTDDRIQSGPIKACKAVLPRVCLLSEMLFLFTWISSSSKP